MDFEAIKTSLIAFFTTGAGATIIALIIGVIAAIIGLKK